MMQGGKGPNSTSIRSANLPPAGTGTPPIPLRPGPFLFVMTSAAVGSDEQIFGTDKQVSGRDVSD